MATDGLGGPGCGAGVSAASAGPHLGFRNLFGPPATADRHGGEVGADRLADLMPGLARLMHAPDRRRPPDDQDNRKIPAGYTYLLQLVAHDLVDSTGTFATAGAGAEPVRNLRASPLRLDTLYGGGPAACPHAYEPPARRGATPTRLRLGRLGAEPGGAPDAAAARPFRDLARLAADDGVSGAPRPGRSLALVADARSDGNVNAAQTAVLFAAFHNAVLDSLAPGPAAAGRPDLDAVRFACAREAATLAYRRVIRCDLLRRLLDPAVYGAYVEGPGRLLDAAAAADGPGDGPDLRMPLEFSQGASRLGHAMVRDEYRFHDRASQELPGILTRTSARGPAGVPLSPAWTWRFANFFEMDGAPGRPRRNPSRRLNPRLAAGLLMEDRFGAIDGTGAIGLAYRDLMSANRAGLWSVPALYRRIAELGAQAPGRDPLAGAPLAGEAARLEALRAWLAEDRAVSRFSDADIEALAKDPPLNFYVLFEADHERGGERLGRLGSIIVAEVVLGAMARDPLPSEAEGPDWLGRAVRRLLERDLPGELAAIADMPGLVRFTAKAGGLDAPGLPFV